MLMVDRKLLRSNELGGRNTYDIGWQSYPMIIGTKSDQIQNADID